MFAKIDIYSMVFSAYRDSYNIVKHNRNITSLAWDITQQTQDKFVAYINHFSGLTTVTDFISPVL